MQYDEEIEKKIKTIWDTICGSEQCLLKYAASVSKKEGSGIVIFNFRNISADKNCEVKYCDKDSGGWEKIRNDNSGFDDIVKIYDPKIHFLIYVVIPSPNERTIDEAVGQLRIFRYDKIQT